MSPFQISVFRKPTRRSTAGAVAFISIEPAAAMKVMVPLSIADLPKPNCIIKGSRNGNAPAVMRVRDPASIDSANVGMRVSPKSMIGAGCRRACQK